MGNNTEVDPIQPDCEDLVEEMKVIIRLAENTECRGIRIACKNKLKQLSQIPLHNEWSIETIKNYG